MYYVIKRLTERIQYQLQQVVKGNTSPRVARQPYQNIYRMNGVIYHPDFELEDFDGYFTEEQENELIEDYREGESSKDLTYEELTPQGWVKFN